MRSAASGGKIGSESPKEDESRLVQPLSASRTSSIAFAEGWSSSVGTSSGNAISPAFDSGVGKGAS
jgi:hypothetical protein